MPKQGWISSLTYAKRWRGIGFLLLAFLGLAACTETVASADNAAGEHAGALSQTSSLPPTYVDRKIEHLQAGVNTLREGYQHSVAVCQSAGLPTRSLSAEETSRIGTKRWQFWRISDRIAYRVESWTAVNGDVRRGKHCEFTLVLDGQHVYFDANKTVRIDLATGEREQSDPELDRLRIVDATPDQKDLRAWSNWEGPMDQTVAGQPCAAWRSPRGDISCYWSGGTTWGFSYLPQGIFGSNAGFATGTLVLQAEPAPGATGDRLTTTEFILGQPIDPKDMLP